MWQHLENVKRRLLEFSTSMISTSTATCSTPGRWTTLTPDPCRWRTDSGRPRAFCAAAQKLIMILIFIVALPAQ